jgi:O-acetyl-ADP-ribose deacetylase (regulator of RNase III)
MDGSRVITEAEGNLLDADVDALVNTVNTVGVMGKGIALQFRRAYPAMFEDYSRAVKQGAVQTGRMHLWETGLLAGPRFIINFPTKRHWRAGSKIEWIDAGLRDLVRTIEEYKIRSIALPPLGCGNGGLAWSDVKPLIVDALGALNDVDVLLFPPGQAVALLRWPPVAICPG